MANVRFEVFMSGTVQGVGFRYRALQISKSFDVYGTIQNLADGRIKLIVEGDSGTIERFIQEVQETSLGKVSNTTISRLPANGQFSLFKIVQ